ncbi:helix-turn-helix domain-containing protein [Celeribacter indicus]|uniref:helix-turn-helix domain-containing protein n=1 Tax=Celeribacter indicus TaxID=1208324 RepID=UPI0008992F44|nr:AraC family transcriptional regulator [Celeribacter indicus]SDW39591.1 AraC-type DNA-binding protein [Celeribacter indicus]
MALQEVEALSALGETFKREIVAPSKHALFAESLAVGLATGLLELPAPGEEEAEDARSGGLTPAQMRRLRTLVQTDSCGRLTNAVLAEAVGLSPSWFSHAFKKTTGKTPLQWQQERRVAMVKEALLAGDIVIADVAARFGFADQAHLTRVFRRYEGTTPAAWLREQRTR